ncbi:retrovirus-related pol polyprotein from transposon TNT 1-94 [Tanacetum coccineum]|uniref:Retrovirus-related pol polyprotein from transposon TNT 1-94 n=1 Tax=Tanacetum coccineum TaxID=301880 RepID=A0ABQ5IXP1_9ASTR
MLASGGFMDTDIPIRVNKLKKAIYWLKQAPRAWYDMLSSFLISQDFSKGSVDPTMFIRKEGKELLLDSPKLLGPTEKHLHPVKIIFRYLKGIVNRGLWYPKDSSIALIAFADADHAGCQDTSRIISGSMQFLGDRLISCWQTSSQKPLVEKDIERIEFLIKKLGNAEFTAGDSESIAVVIMANSTYAQQKELDDALVALKTVTHKVYGASPSQHGSTNHVGSSKLHNLPSLMLLPIQASKGKRIKTSAKGDKPATKSKGLTVLSEVALSEADQMKLATKRSMKEFQSSHASGSGDGVDIQSKVPDEQQQTLSGTNKRASDKPEVPDVHKYRSESEEESWTFSQEEDDEDNDEHDSANDNDDEDDNQENVKEENQLDDDKVIGGEQENEEDEELYGDLNLILDTRDAIMTYAQTNQETKEAHVTLTTKSLVVQQQSSSVSSDLVSKLINPTPDTYTELFELKQTNQFAKALSSILNIVDNYLVSKMKEAIDVVVQLKSDKLREEAQTENQDFLNSLDSDMKRIIKEQVKA